MSRSFKKVAGYVDRSPFMKRYSNKSLRKASKNSLQASSDYSQYDGKVPLFSGFKRGPVNSYSICDYRTLYYSKIELVESCIHHTAPIFYGTSLFTTNVMKAHKNFTNCKVRKNFTNCVVLRKYHKALSK